MALEKSNFMGIGRPGMVLRLRSILINRQIEPQQTCTIFRKDDSVGVLTLRLSSATHLLTLAVALAILLSPCSAIAQIIQQIQEGVPETQQSSQEEYGGVYLPSDRMDSRGIHRAIKLIDAGEYTQAIGFLDEVLAREEDSFRRTGKWQRVYWSQGDGQANLA